MGFKQSCIFHVTCCSFSEVVAFLVLVFNIFDSSHVFLVSVFFPDLHHGLIIRSLHPKRYRSFGQSFKIGKIRFHILGVMANQPTPPGHVPASEIRVFNKALLKGNQWLIGPDHKALFLRGTWPGGVWLTSGGKQRTTLELENG